MKKLLIMFIILIVFNKCSQKTQKNYYKNYEEFQPATNIKKINFEKFNEEKYMMPPVVKVINNKYLVTLTNGGKDMVQVYNINTKEEVQVLGRTGKGPGEYISPWDILFTKKAPNQLIIYDLNLRRLNKYIINYENEENILELDTIVNIDSENGFPTALSLINKDTVVALGALASRLCYYNSNGEYIGSNEYIPGKKPDNIAEINYLSAIYQSQIDVMEDKKIVITCNYNSDLIEIFSYNGEVVKTLHGPDVFFPEYKISNSNKIFIKDIRYGYTDICTSDKYFYCIYSGKKRNKNWANKFSSTLLVFDLNGNPIETHITNYDIGQIEINSKNNELYALCYDGSDFFIGYSKLNNE